MKPTRRPDRRIICDTKTYTVEELAAETGRSASTVYQWIRDGLPVASHDFPKLIFGYQARSWLAKRWAAKRRTALLGQIFCFGCQQPRWPRPDSLSVQLRPNNLININGNCSVCERQVNRGTRRDDVADLLLAAGASLDEVEGFKDSLISASNPVNEPSLAGNSGTDIKVRGQHLPQNIHNERLKRKHFEHAKHACGRDDNSITKDVIALFRFEAYFGYRDFDKWTAEEFIAFKAFLRQTELTLPVQKATLKSVKAFLLYLRQQKGYARKIPLARIEYLNLSRKDMRAATMPERIVDCPTPIEVSTVLRYMPTTTKLQRRNRFTVAAFALLGLRATAMVSLRLKHVDLQHNTVVQNAREVRTKNSKHQTTIFMPYDPLWLEIFLDYLKELRAEGFSDEDPLFPAIQRGIPGGCGAGFRKQFVGSGHASTIIKRAFVAAGLPAYTAHTFRHMWVKIGFARSPEMARAISENLGHANLQISHQNYGRSSLEERGLQIAKGFKSSKESAALAEQLELLAQQIRGAEN